MPTRRARACGIENAPAHLGICRKIYLYHAAGSAAQGGLPHAHIDLSQNRTGGLAVTWASPSSHILSDLARLFALFASACANREIEYSTKSKSMAVASARRPVGDSRLHLITASRGIKEIYQHLLHAPGRYGDAGAEKSRRDMPCERLLRENPSSPSAFAFSLHEVARLREKVLTSTSCRAARKGGK